MATRGDSDIPDYVASELSEHKLAIIRKFKSGAGHWTVEFTSPTGDGTCRWSWPSPSKCRPRSMMNNRSELRRYIRSLECRKRTTDQIALALVSKKNTIAL